MTKTITYLSVCSGIEAATVAWSVFGWEAAAFAEIESFPCSVLAYRYPNVRNLGDMTQINGADFKGKIDLLVGGTPCQSFSVAGLRKGLEDERGNLSLEFARIADESDPAFIVWENVPGVLSDRGNAFGCLLAALAGEDAPLVPPGGRWTNAGYVLGPQRTIAFCVRDAQYFGLAQRRKRVFLVACPRNGTDPRKILFEFDGMRRDFAPGREAGADLAGTLESGLGRSRGAGTSPAAITQALTGRLGGGGPDDNKAQGGFYVAAFGGNNTSGSIDVSPALNAHGSGSRRLDFESEAFVCGTLNANGKAAGSATQQDAECGLLVAGPLTNVSGTRGWSVNAEQAASGYLQVAQTLRAEGFDASEDGTGRQNLVVVPPLTHKVYGDNASREGALIPIAFDTTQITSSANGSNPRPGDPCHPIAAQGHPPAIAFHGSQDPYVSGDVTHPLGTNQGMEACVMVTPINTQVGLRHNALGERTGLGIGEVGDPAFTLQAGHHHAVSISCAPMAFTERGRKEGRTLETQPDLAYALTNPGSGGRTHSRQILDAQAAVRRLTPRECERLQGFPDDYTLIPYKRPFAELPRPVLDRSYKRYLRRMRRQAKPALPLDELIRCADGPRYKALGNSMAVPVMRWIGRRIDMAVRAAHAHEAEAVCGQ